MLLTRSSARTIGSARSSSSIASQAGVVTSKYTRAPARRVFDDRDGADVAIVPGDDAGEAVQDAGAGVGIDQEAMTLRFHTWSYHLSVTAKAGRGRLNVTAKVSRRRFLQPLLRRPAGFADSEIAPREIPGQRNYG